MDQIYVTFAMPHCVDPTFYMSTQRILRAIFVFSAVLILAYFWSNQREHRVLFYFLIAIIGIYLSGVIASYLQVYGYLKLYPFRLANSIPMLFLIIFTLSFIGSRWPRERLTQLVWGIAAITIVWSIDSRNVFSKDIPDIANNFVHAFEGDEPGRYGRAVKQSRRAVYRWITQNTEKDSVFATPYLSGFWSETGRAQVAALRHPPHDKKLIEWKERLDKMNRSRPFKNRGLIAKKEFTLNQARLPKEDLKFIRDEYNATHYITNKRRTELALHLLYADKYYAVYLLKNL